VVRSPDIPVWMMFLFPRQEYLGYELSIAIPAKETTFL